MRMIGHIQSESNAQTFSAYLYVQGIKNQIEAEKDGTWALWVHAEDELAKARQLFQDFMARPNAPEYQRAAKEARELMDKEKEQEQAADKRFFHRSQIFRNYGPYGMGPLTTALIAFCVVVWIITVFGMDRPALADFIQALFISEIDYARNLPEVRQGQVWRIFTPIFVHSTMFLHILFNMLWLKDLGSMIEARQGSFRLALLVIIISAASNLAEYFVTGPRFMGMSGVVYGLLGYIWMKGKFDPASGLFLHPTTVVMMLIWFVICLTNLTGPIRIANVVHGVGLGLGVAWGYLSAIGPFSRRH
ncbi:MAG: rhomboid family intramembrane serine protease [Verrucomicrobia bacterium]|nr:rhomboid family intramembrane serine protease [Verrucomicrobiota bacterium]